MIILSITSISANLLLYCFRQDMKQIISIHVGQAGIQLGNSCWQLFAQQHSITPTGILANNINNDGLNIFFNEQCTGRYRPRSIFIDLQPTAIDQLRTGPLRGLYNHEQMAAGKEDTAGIFSRGYYCKNKSVMEIALNRIREAAQQCHKLEGFIIYNSIGGGTGSGFATLLREKLAESYSKKMVFWVHIFPNPQLSYSCVEPYNSVLALHKILQHEDGSIIFDNSALTNICNKQLDIDTPTFTNFNAISAQAISSLTTSYRINRYHYLNLEQMYRRTIPYPCLPFLSSSYSPFVSAERAYLNQQGLQEMTISLFHPLNQFANINPSQGKFMTCQVYYRGEQIVARDVSSAIAKLKLNNTVNFVDWAPAGFKVILNHHTPIHLAEIGLPSLAKDCFAIGSTSAVADVFARIDHRFDFMYYRRAFVHWYIRDGGELDEFIEARERLATLEMDYHEIEQQREEHDGQDC